VSTLASMAKGMFVAAPGHTFVARDFSGIEAVLVGWFAKSHKYTRLAKLGVHDYFNAHLLAKDGKILTSDLPDLAWSDDDLRAYFKPLKAKFKTERDVAKRCVHLSNYLGTPGKMNEEYPDTFKTKRDAALIQAFYFEVFPEVRAWHIALCKQVDKSGFMRAPSGFIHRFYRVLQWRKIGGEWVSDFGDDAKRLIAFGPQHTAAYIGKLALRRIWTGYPLARTWLRLFIHDEIFMEVPSDQADDADDILKIEMEQEVKCLPLPEEWGMGSYLTIGSESKRGESWGSMA
jgi:hypothetical protein